MRQIFVLLVSFLFLGLTAAEFVAFTGAASYAGSSPNSRFIALFAQAGAVPYQAGRTGILYDRELNSSQLATILPSGDGLPERTRVFPSNDGKLALFAASLPASRYRSSALTGVYVRNTELSHTFTIPLPEGTTGPYVARQLITGSTNLAVFSDNTQKFHYAELAANGSFITFVTASTETQLTGYLTSDMQFILHFSPTNNRPFIINRSTGAVIYDPTSEDQLFLDGNNQNYRAGYVSPNGASFLMYTVINGMYSFKFFEVSAAGAVALRSSATDMDTGDDTPGDEYSASNDGSVVTLSVASNLGSSTARVCVRQSENLYDCPTGLQAVADSVFGVPPADPIFGVAPNGLVLARNPGGAPAFVNASEGTFGDIFVSDCFYELQQICDLKNQSVGVFRDDANSDWTVPVMTPDGSLVAFESFDRSIYVKNLMTNSLTKMQFLEGMPWLGRKIARSYLGLSNDGKTLLVQASDGSGTICSISNYWAVFNTTTGNGTVIRTNLGACAGYGGDARGSIAADGSYATISTDSILADGEALVTAAVYYVDFVANTSRRLNKAEFGLPNACYWGFVFNNRSGSLLMCGDNFNLYYLDMIANTSRAIDIFEGVPYASTVDPNAFLTQNARYIGFISDDDLWILDTNSGAELQKQNIDTAQLESSFNFADGGSYWSTGSDDARYWVLYGSSTGARPLMFDTVTGNFTELVPKLNYDRVLSGSISANGQKIAIATDKNLDRYDINGALDIYVCNRDGTNCQIASVLSTWNPPAPPALPPVVPPPMAPPVSPPVNEPVAPPVDPPLDMPPTASPVDPPLDMPPTASPVDPPLDMPPTASPVNAPSDVPLTASPSAVSAPVNTPTSTPTSGAPTGQSVAPAASPSAAPSATGSPNSETAPPVSSPVVTSTPVLATPLAQIVVTLNGTVAPNQTFIQQICVVIANSFQPPLVVGTQLVCRLADSSSRRAILATYVVVGDVFTPEAASSVLAQSSSVSSSITSQINSLDSSYTVGSIRTQTPSTAPVSSAPSVQAPAAAGISEGQASGVTVGIIIAVFLGVAIIAVVLFVIIRKKRSSEGSDRTASATVSAAEPKSVKQAKVTNAESGSSSQEESSSEQESEEDSEESSDEEDEDESESSDEEEEDGDERNNEEDSQEQSSSEGSEESSASDESSTEEASSSNEDSSSENADSSSEE